MNSCNRCGAPFEENNKDTCSFCGASIIVRQIEETEENACPIRSIETSMTQQTHDDSFDYLSERPTVLTVTCIIAWILFVLEFIGSFLLEDEYSKSEMKFMRYVVFAQAYAYFLIWDMKKKGFYIFLLIAIIDTVLTILINGEPIWADIVIYLIFIVIPFCYIERMDND